jgi:hypothetical protein
MQIPIGLEGNHKGVIDLIRQTAVYFEEPSGLVKVAFEMLAASFIFMQFAAA